jgi:hypothetical protein
MFNVTIEQVDDAVVLRVRGVIDARTEPAFFNLLAHAFTVARDVVVVDLSTCSNTAPGFVQALEAAALLLERRGMHLFVSDGRSGAGMRITEPARG